MREHKIRFGESAWQLIRDEAAREGVRPTVFVREATLAYAVWLRARRGEDNGEDSLIERLRELRRLD